MLMLIVFFRYIFVLIGFAIVAMLLYRAFDYNKLELGPIDVLEYLVPAFIAFGIAYRSYPRAEQRN